VPNILRIFAVLYVSVIGLTLCYKTTVFYIYNSITSWDMDRSLLFTIGLTLRGPRNGFLVFLRSGVFVVYVSGYLLAKSDKIWVSEALRFSPHFITGLLTTRHLMALKLPLWWYLFRYYFFYFAYSSFSHFDGPSQRVNETIACRVPDCSKVRISEFKLVNCSRELVNYQFELGPDRSSPTWVTWRWQLTRRSPSEISLLYNTAILCVFLNADKLVWER